MAHPTEASVRSYDRAAYLFLLSGAQDWPLKAWHLGQKQHQSRDWLTPSTNAKQARRGQHGGVTNLSLSLACVLRPVCLGPCPTMTGPLFSFTHLLTLSGLLCHSAGYLSKCVRAHVSVCYRGRRERERDIEREYVHALFFFLFSFFF